MLRYPVVEGGLGVIPGSWSIWAVLGFWAESYLMIFINSTRTVFSMDLNMRHSWTLTGLDGDNPENGLKASTAATTFWARGGRVLTRGARLFKVAVMSVGSLSNRC